jgi:hypothetical protein
MPCGGVGRLASAAFKPFVSAGLAGMLDGGALKMDFCNSVVSTAAVPVVGGSNVPLSLGMI